MVKEARKTDLYERSFQGRKHAERDMPCQDFCGHCFTPNGWIAAAVADGVSASPRAEVGAAAAVQGCLAYMAEFRYSPSLTMHEIQEILCDAMNYALRRVQEADIGLKEVPFAKFTTLHLLLYGENIGLHWGQTGDGAAFLMNREGHWKRLSPRMRNEEENAPATLQDGPDVWQFGSVDAADVDIILMTTDGLSDVLSEAPEEKEVTEAALRLLTAAAAAGEENPDASCDALLFGGEYAVPEETPAAQEAISRFRSVTDDITLIVIQNLNHQTRSGDNSRREEAAEPEKASQPSAPKRTLRGLLSRLFTKGISTSQEEKHGGENTSV